MSIVIRVFLSVNVYSQRYIFSLTLQLKCFNNSSVPKFAMFLRATCATTHSQQILGGA